MTRTLRDHRRQLADADPESYTFEIEKNITRLCSSLVPHLRSGGYPPLAGARREEALARIIRFLFDAQDQRPMFHVEGTELPMCWNSPRDWDKPYIKYEWGHLLSRNQNETRAHRIANLALYSARCNQHIQTSMDIQELMVYGGIIAQRVSLVLTSRRRLFLTEQWRAASADLGEPR